ncbi:MAG: hypothetical protein FWG75_09685 [Cystobacterineae bacterium]|nr:hypothetical protein [Cystobacterineae bacterium]
MTGEKGECVVGELGADGKLKMAIRSWRLLQKNEEIAPLRFDKEEVEWKAEDNPGAGWVGMGSADFYLAATGSVEVGTKLEAIVGEFSYACEPVLGKCRLGNCEWVCKLPEQWAGEGPEIELSIKLGAQGLTRKRTYRVGIAPPHIDMETDVSSAALGEELGLCATQGMQEGEEFIPVRVWQVKSAKLSHEASEVPMEGWKQEAVNNAEIPYACWRAALPLNIRLGVLEESAVQLSVVLEVTDAAGNTFEIGKNFSLQLRRTFCRTNAIEHLGAHVTQPLAFSKYPKEEGRLIFGASGWPSVGDETNNSLYFYGEHCNVVGRFHSGSIRGPMVVMGSVGQMAIAVAGGGPTGRDGSRLALVNTRSLPPRFYHSGTGSNSMDCVSDQNSQGSSALSMGASIFDKGLTLTQIGDIYGGWRLVAPGNKTDSGSGYPHLLAFVTDNTSINGRCLSTSTYGTYPPMHLTPVQVLRQQPEETQTLLVTRFEDDNIAYWRFRESDGGLGSGAVFDSITGGALEGPTGLAATAQHVWLSGKGNNGPSLQRWNFLVGNAPGALVNVQTESYRTSPVAVDEEGRVYAVVETGPNTYQLRRFEAEADSTNPPEVVGLPRGIAEPVGSPILGEPLGENPAELYIVTTNGTVLAFAAERLELLWTQHLGSSGVEFSIASTAQPVLVPDASGGAALWVVGKRGEIRGLRVASTGLRRRAIWPKAFRDNCNTSAQISVPTNERMENCF